MTHFKTLAWRPLLGAAFLSLTLVPLSAQENPPRLTHPTLTTNGQQRIGWQPVPATEGYRLRSTTNLLSPWEENASGSVTEFEWVGPQTGAAAFPRLEVTPVSSNALLTFNALNRLAYGPTPDELERVLTGPEAGARLPTDFTNRSPTSRATRRFTR
jgi:hypothetical protein